MNENNYIVYNKIKFMCMKDIKRKYKHKDTLLYYSKINKDLYAVIAEIKNTKDFNHHDFFNFIEKQDSRFDFKKYPYRSLNNIEHVPYKVIFDKPKIISTYKFYKDKLKLIKEYTENCNLIWDVENEDIFICFSENPADDTISLHGYGFDKKFREQELSKDIFMFSYNQLLKRAQEYLSVFENNKEDKIIYADEITENIKIWLNKTSYQQFEKVLTLKIRGQKEVKIIAFVIYDYLSRLVNKMQINNNTVIAAPSGSGKTETFRVLRDYFREHIKNLDIIQVDISGFSEIGFRGRNIEDMLKPLAKKNNGGIAIVFIDEFDKKLIPSYTSTGQNTNLSVQSELLTIVEGAEIEVNNIVLDTNKTLFVGVGAFNAVREHKAEAKESIGFLRDDLTSSKEHYESITRKDIIKLGGSYELIGRFCYIVNYNKLDNKAINLIINDIILEEEKYINIRIKLSDSARNELLSNSNTEFGVRLLRSMIQESLISAKIQIFKNDKLTIDKIKINTLSDVQVVYKEIPSSIP